MSPQIQNKILNKMVHQNGIQLKYFRGKKTKIQNFD